jgi:hypothetical protein
MSNIYATFKNYTDANQFAKRALDVGFRQDQLSLMTNQSGDKGEQEKKLAERVGHSEEKDPVETVPTKEQEDTLADTGLASVAIPGVGLVTGGGGLSSSLGNALGEPSRRTVSGAMADYMDSRGVPVGVAQRFSEALEQDQPILELWDISGSDHGKAIEMIKEHEGEVIAETD